jgi:cytoskeletal protein RodZ
MKSCPTCNRTYSDDTITFCLVDGSILSAPYDSEATQAFPYPQNTEPSKAANTIPSSPSPPIFIPETKQSQVSEKRSRKRGLIFGVVIIIVLTTGLIIGLGWNSLFGNNNSQAKQSGSVDQTNNTVAKTLPTATQTAAPTVTPQTSPSPKTTPQLVKKLDITGTWTGTFANRDAILFINSQNGDSFSGILKNSKKAIIAVSGRINPNTRQISIQENRVVEEATEGPGWILGSNSGSLSTDGKEISGSGKDKAGHVYTWSFNK